MSKVIIDNFLKKDIYERIKNVMISGEFPWYYNDTVSSKSDTENFFFVHTFYQEYQIQSEFFGLMEPFVNKLQPKAISRIKANLYPRNKTLIQHKMHHDINGPHLGGLYYVNTNNGATVFENGDRVDSVSNRFAFLNTYDLHASTNCTDGDYRIVINFNYF